LTEPTTLITSEWLVLTKNTRIEARSSLGVFKHNFGARKGLGIALWILYEQAELSNELLKLRVKIACMSR
jgi:hypothetical protein